MTAPTERTGATDREHIRVVLGLLERAYPDPDVLTPAQRGAIKRLAVTMTAPRGEAQRTAEERLAEALAFIGRWVDAAKPSESPEALEWRRVTKVCSEAGEVQDALDIATGGNPRKVGTKTYADVEKELLDAAGAALGAVEFLRRYDGQSLGLLVRHMERVAARAAGAS